MHAPVKMSHLSAGSYNYVLTAHQDVPIHACQGVPSLGKPPVKMPHLLAGSYVITACQDVPKMSHL